MALPQPRFACPICGAAVHLHHVTEWATDDGEIIGVEYDCETEPDIDSPEYGDWFREHWSHPYCDWLPWETEMLAWLNANCYYGDEHEGGDE